MANKLFNFGLILTILTILLIFIAILLTNYREHEMHSGFVFTLAGFTFIGALGCWVGYWTVKIKSDVGVGVEQEEEEQREKLKSESY